ncbi:hypothetical protein NQ314_004655 [Rhamnusium bicolor]|uniref:Regulatory protein zeste n=1 Tax=Rhamnusium bicolor TaxID=1586634 RepID=A0AAV8ZJC9_9CUCU|nr:hypothetical protein NQ314_004655 [Rhamnusium bicolor]
MQTLLCSEEDETENILLESGNEETETQFETQITEYNSQENIEDNASDIQTDLDECIISEISKRPGTLGSADSNSMSFKVRDAYWQTLLEAMERNPVIATGKFMGPNGKANYKKLWDETAKKINALGFGSKSTEKWQKTWADYKYNLKKAASIKKNISKTGEGPSEEKDLTDLDLKLLDMLGEHFIGLEEP